MASLTNTQASPLLASPKFSCLRSKSKRVATWLPSYVPLKGGGVCSDAAMSGVSSLMSAGYLKGPILWSFFERSTVSPRVMKPLAWRKQENLAVWWGVFIWTLVECCGEILWIFLTNCRSHIEKACASLGKEQVLLLFLFGSQGTVAMTGVWGNVFRRQGNHSQADRHFRFFGRDYLFPRHVT